MTDSVPDRVRRAIERSGATRREFATGIGLDETKLSKSLAGRRRFTTDELAAIAARVGIPLTELVRPVVTATPGPSVRPAPVDDPDGARKRILDAAWTLIAERGYHQVRVADVANAAGTSSAAVHYHFPGKEALLGEALRHNVELAFDRQSAALADLPDPHARLLRLLDLQMPDGPVLEPEWSIWMQVWVEAVLDAAPDDQRRRELYREAQDRWFRTVLMTLHDGAEAGAFRAGDQELRARQLTALVDGLGIGVMTRASDVAEMRAALRDFVDHTIVRGDHP
ncbi:TetR family transcriptional regulator [Actinomycetospora endophytica]|uniref:TetR family transcriptional regulator n=1 Tax=Actinomycetospora endophytica TaxID=2291215 RepID=A0ABS8PDR6_9PSEU|nr:TetR family transcriptional regulator [Actinomycetospora endophytica]MCD2195605.1 TetR family transcriptional regulator [Actinomycetospora endophytica]